MAIKSLFDPRETQRTVEDFKREINMLKMLNHPNIVRFIAANEEPPDMYIALELCELSLFQILHERNDLKEPQSVSICADVARGMSYLHSHTPPIMHRDIKSQNVLLSSGCGKICDFGLADFASNSPHHPFAGTPAYMAPEILIKTPNFDIKNDVYSFAVLVWETFVRKIPFQQLSSRAEVAEFVCNGGRLDLENAEIKYRAPIKKLLENCWKKDINLRPTFRAILTELEQLEKSYSRNTNSKEWKDSFDDLEGELKRLRKNK